MKARVLMTVALLALAGFLSQVTWAEELPSDPRIVTRKLTNGVTWMYRQHDNPPGRMALVVHVNSGSLMEQDSQRGLAHFMEHMAFNGSEHFAPGELIPYFESIGMEFGGDINAFTSFDQTVFMIFLPNTKLEEVDKALMVLSDQAFRCLLLEDEIDKERGVVLAEIRAGKSAEQRIRDRLWPQVFAGSRFANRMVLGLEEVISDAPRSEFVDYYRTWYRPERITLVMVGDADPGPLVPAIEKWFGEYRPTASAREEPGAQFKPFTQQRAVVVTDPEYERCQVTMYNILPGRRPTTTVAEARTELVEGIGSWILRRRFDERVKKGEASCHSAGGGVMNFFGEALLVVGSADGEPSQWEQMLEELIVEVSRAREHGFTARELELAKSEIVADAERALNTEPTRNARAIAMEMIQAVNDREPVMSATQELELIRRLLPMIELKEVSAAFATNFVPGTFAYTVQMPEKEGIEPPTNEEVLAAARAALARQLEPPKDEQRAKELLAADPRPGKVVESSTDDELKVTHFRLENGARGHHRFMDYKKDLVLLSISLGGARLEETAANAGVTEVAALAFNQPATKRLSSTEIADIMTGKQIELRAEFIERDSLDLLVTGSPKDLEVGLQLAHALLTDGRIEAPAFKKWVATSLQQYERYRKAPQFAALAALLEMISGNDPRVTMPDPDRIKAQSLERAQAWLERLCREAPIEVAIVGEIKLDDALPLIEKYIGSLPNRPSTTTRLDSLRKLNRGAGPFDRQVRVDTITPQAMVFYGFAGSDAQDEHDSQALELAAKTLDSKLIERVREELGLVYSIGVQSEPSAVFEDAGMFVTGAPCAPDKAEELMREIEGLFTAFAQDGPTEDELANAKKQVLNGLDLQMKEPTFWWGKLQYADLHRVNLNELKHLNESYEALTSEQVRNVFRKYYVPQRRYRVVALPAGATEPAIENGASEPVPVTP